MSFPIRKATRLQGYDYSQNGAYFITVCTRNKRKLFCDIVGEGLCALPRQKLTPIGKVVENTILYLDDTYEDISVDKFIVMPNHIHCLLQIYSSGGRGGPPLPQWVGQLKSFTTHQYGGRLWQRSFHDHIIRNQRDYDRIWNYIDTNPIRWENDCFFVK